MLASVLLCGLGTPAAAMNGVDLSRVKFSAGSEIVELQFGNISIEGKASQVYPFTEQEINKLVQETLKAMELTQLDIIEANRAVEKAHRATTVTAEDLQRVKDNLLTSMGVVPAAGNVSAVLGYIDQYMTSKSWDDIGTVSVNMGESAMSDLVKDTAKGYISNTGDLGDEIVKKGEWAGNLINIAKFCDMIADEHARDKQKWRDIAAGANAKRLLNGFYDKLQDRIDAYKYMSDKAGWQIKFGQAMDYRGFKFFGVGSNYQYWTLDLLLNQKTTDSLGSIAGNYEGFYSITASHDMSGFTERVVDAAQTMEPVEKLLKAYQNIKDMKLTLSTSSKGAVSIERIINGDCEAVIDTSGQISLTMHESADNTTVKFTNIKLDVNVLTGSGGNVPVIKLTFPVEMSNKKESVILKFLSLDINDLSPGVNIDKAFSADGSVADAGWDEEIWKPWDGTEKKLVLVGKK